jgi:hypothetical protein
MKTREKERERNLLYEEEKKREGRRGEPLYSFLRWSVCLISNSREREREREGEMSLLCAR